MSTESTEEAFLRYVRPHWKRLYLMARRYVAHEEDARDLVQETLVKAWRYFSSTAETPYKRSWLFVIMRHAARDWYRSARRRVKLSPASDSELTETASADPTEPFYPLPAIDEARFREFLDERVAAALDTLDAPFREVLFLSALGNLSYREIGEVLDCPVGTVMSRMARARRALRERLSSYARAAGWVREGRS